MTLSTQTMSFCNASAQLCFGCTWGNGCYFLSQHASTGYFRGTQLCGVRGDCCDTYW